MHLNIHTLILFARFFVVFFVLSQVKLCLFLFFQQGVSNLNAIIPTIIFQTKTKVQIFQNYYFAGEILVQTRRWVPTQKYIIAVPMLCPVVNKQQYYATLDSLDVNFCSILWSSSCCADVFIYMDTFCCKLWMLNINLTQNL